MFSTPIILLFAIASAMCSSESRFTLSVDGKQVTPEFVHVEGTPDKLSGEDLFVVRGYLFAIGSKKERQLHIKEMGKEIWETDQDGNEYLIAAEVEKTYWDVVNNRSFETPIIRNPFRTMTAAQLQKVCSIKLKLWNDDVAVAIKQMESDKLVVELNGYATVGQGELPSLPSNLKWLRVYESDNQKCIRDYNAAQKLGHLRYLSISSMIATVDCRSFAQSRLLKQVSLRARELQNPEVFGDIKELRNLDLRYNKSLSEISFVSKLTKLEKLNISGTSVSDLGAMGGHPSLQQIEAQELKIRRLPIDREMPALTSLKALSSHVSAEQASLFRKRNPKCKLDTDWNQTLADALNGVDRIRIRSGGTCHRNVAQERTLHVEKDAATIQNFLANLGVEEKDAGLHCMCCGEPSFEFFKGDVLVTTIGYHHGRSLRWPEGWPGDAILKPDAKAFLQDYLARRAPMKTKNAQ